MFDDSMLGVDVDVSWCVLRCDTTAAAGAAQANDPHR